MKTYRVIRRFITLFLLLAVLLTSVPFPAAASGENSPNAGATIPQRLSYEQDGTKDVYDAVPSQVIDTDAIAGQIMEDVHFAEALKSDNDMYEVARSLLIREYSLYYDVFPAAVVLDDGTEIPGIGYSDFGAYFASGDEERSFFPAGFLSDCGESAIPESAVEKGLVVYNLDYENESYGFVYSYETSPFWEHCVINGQYLKYGVDQSGVITYEVQPYIRGHCEESLGALYSFDENRYVYDPNVGEYRNISGSSLYELIDYDALEKETNQILASQDEAFSQVEITSSAYFAQEAVEAYLLSCQQEIFMGYDVDLLVAEVQALDPTELIRFTPEGYIVIPIENDIPEAPSDFAKWIVAASCGIVIIGSTALNIFVPAARPVSGAITGAAIDVFMQVVAENRAISDIQWNKVAVAAVSGSLMAWACPLGASAVTSSVGKATGSIALSKLAGYGVLTFSNAFVSGITNSTFALIDDQPSDDVWDAFLLGATVGAGCTVTASALSEIVRPIGNTLSGALNAKHPNSFLTRAENATATFIGKHQVKLSNAAVEEILNPKSVYAAAQAARFEYVRQGIATGRISAEGGKYDDLVPAGMERHEMPSFYSKDAETRGGPAIRMEPSSVDARDYRATQRRLMQEGHIKAAIQMDIDDIHNKFDHKYDEAIEQMLAYAESIGWW